MLTSPVMVACEKGHVWDVSTVKVEDNKIRASIGYCIKPIPGPDGKPIECGGRVIWKNPEPLTSGKNHAIL
jgi:hypothetical protein